MTRTQPNLAPLEAGSRALVLGLGRTGLSCARYLRGKVSTCWWPTRVPNRPGLRRCASRCPGRAAHGAFQNALLDGVAQVVISPGCRSASRSPSRRGSAGCQWSATSNSSRARCRRRSRRSPVPTARARSRHCSPNSQRRRPTGRRGRQPRRAGARPARAPGARALRARTLELPARDHPHAPCCGRRRPERHAGPPRSLRHDRRLRRREGAHLRPLRRGRGERGRRPRPRHADCRAARPHVQPAGPVGGLFPRPGAGTGAHLPWRGAAADVGNQVAGRAQRGKCTRRARHVRGARVAASAVLDALAAFGGLPHRAQWIADVGGVRFVDDSKGTNVGATIAAVSGLAGPLVLIAGGDGKNQDFDELRPVCQGKVRHVVLIGRDAPRWRLSSRACAAASGRPTCAPPSVRRARPRNRGTPCCSHRPAPASTCSVTMRTAATSSLPRSEPCRMSAATLSYARSTGRPRRLALDAWVIGRWRRSAGRPGDGGLGPIGVSERELGAPSSTSSAS